MQLEGALRVSLTLPGVGGPKVLNEGGDTLFSADAEGALRTKFCARERRPGLVESDLGAAGGSSDASIIHIALCSSGSPTFPRKSEGTRNATEARESCSRHESTARGPEAQTVRDIAAIDGCFKLWLEVSNRSSLIARSVGKHVVPSRSNTNPTREGNRSWRISKACVYDLINTTARTSKSAAMVLFLQRTRQPQRCAGTYAARYSLGRDFDVVEATTPKLMLKYDRTAQPVDPGST